MVSDPGQVYVLPPSVVFPLILVSPDPERGESTMFPVVVPPRVRVFPCVVPILLSPPYRFKFPDTVAFPPTSSASRGVVVPIPILLDEASRKKVLLSMFRLLGTDTPVPVRVSVSPLASPRVVEPDTSRSSAMSTPSV